MRQILFWKTSLLKIGIEDENEILVQYATSSYSKEKYVSKLPQKNSFFFKTLVFIVSQGKNFNFALDKNSWCRIFLELLHVSTFLF